MCTCVRNGQRGFRTWERRRIRAHINFRLQTEVAAGSKRIKPGQEESMQLRWYRLQKRRSLSGKKFHFSQLCAYVLLHAYILNITNPRFLSMQMFFQMANVLQTKVKVRLKPHFRNKVSMKIFLINAKQWPSSIIVARSLPICHLWLSHFQSTPWWDVVAASGAPCKSIPTEVSDATIVVLRGALSRGSLRTVLNYFIEPFTHTCVSYDLPT